MVPIRVASSLGLPKTVGLVLVRRRKQRTLAGIFMAGMIVVSVPRARCDADAVLRGLLCFKNEDYRCAEIQFREALKSDPTNVRVQMSLGHALFRQQRPADAIPYYQSALAGERAEPVLSLDERRVLVDQLGMSIGMSGELEKARKFFVAASAEDPTYPSYHYNLACAFAEMSDLKSAERELGLAFQFRNFGIQGETLPDPLADDSFKEYQLDPGFRKFVTEQQTRAAQPTIPTEEAQRKISGILESAKDKGVPAYLEALRRALTIAQEANNPELICFALTITAGIYDTLPDYSEALIFFREALDVAVRNHLVMDELVIRRSIGEVFRKVNRNQDALAFFEQAEQLAKSLGEPTALAYVFNSMGLLAHQRGDYALALRDYLQALPALVQLPDRTSEAWLRNDMGGTYTALGDYASAFREYRQAFDIMRSTGELLGQATILNNMAGVLRYQGQYEDARLMYERALEIVTKIVDLPTQSVILNSLGEANAMLGRYAEAEKYYRQSLTLKIKIGNIAGQATTMNNIAGLLRVQHKYSDAASMLRAGTNLARTAGDVVNEGLLLDNLGVLEEEQKNYEGALKYYSESIDLREGVRAAVHVEEFKTSLMAQWVAAYEHAVLLNVRLRRWEQAFEMSERARSRTFLDQMGNARLDVLHGAGADLLRRERETTERIAETDQALRVEQAKPEDSRSSDTIQTLSRQLKSEQQTHDSIVVELRLANPEYASLATASALTVPQVQARLDKDTTLVSYYVASDQTIAFVITSGNFEVRVLPVTSKQLQEAVKECYPFVSFDVVPDALRDLYRWLVAPLNADLHTPVVALAPHGVLHRVPFAALPSEEGALFGDQHELYELPSASWLQFERSGKRTSTSMLAAAQSRPEGLPELSFADEEVKAVAGLYGGLTLLDVSKRTFKQQAGLAELVHVAAHAQLNGVSPLFSRLVLGADQQEDGSLDVQQVYGLNLERASLITLSACNTAAGQITAGDDIVALNRAFLFAGSSTVLASLWEVNDRATAELMKAFYSELRKGKSKVEALQTAQRNIRHTWPHPYYWAAFVLTGDPGPVATNRWTF